MVEESLDDHRGIPDVGPGAPISRSTFSASDADQVTDYIARTYVGNKTRFGAVHGRAGFAASFADATSIATDRARCSIDYRTVTEPFDFFCSTILTRGRLQLSSIDGDVRLAPGDSAAYPLGVQLQIDCVDQGCLVVRMPFERLEQAAELRGVPANELRLEGATPVSPAMARYWRYHAGLVNGSLLDDDSPMGSPLLREELARMTALGALHVFPNTTMEQYYRPAPGHVAPAAVRRAVAHIDARADQPVTLAEIADAAGVGVRALQYGFRRHLDTTPLGYLRRVRLERAHRELQAADPARGDTVRAIAVRWGFGKPARFAAEHRTAYGELPSQTLRT